MAKKMLIDATHAEETRVVVVDGNKVDDFDFETVNKRQLAGNIYLAKVTRVEPSLQAAFVDYGGNRHGFLAFAEIHPDYYQIPVADRKALIAEERAYAEQMEAEENNRGRRKPRPAARAERNAGDAEVIASDDIPGMGIVDLSDDPNGGNGADETVVAAEPEAGETQPEVAAGEATDEAVASSDDLHDAGDTGTIEVFNHDDHDDGIESVGEEDVAEEIHQARKPRPRRYKIQEVIKVRQIMLVQVVKEERGNKGAALTTYLSLAGRYCVLMPNTARGGGISRKITNAADRKKLKEIASEIEVPEGAGLIIRTAGSQRTKTEIRRDYEYLMRLWEQVRDLTLKSIAPAPIYEEGDLIKRSIRDLYSKEIDEVLVEGAKGYRAAKDFMKMIMPTHAKSVVHYTESMPLFARYQVESYLGAMFNPVVQLKSGGYIVIGVTEALVAIDVNSGRATKEGSIEETALRTNLEAAEEVARQVRLRDLAGLIVIDFIDMEERKNNAAVEKRLKDKLKTDRARIQVGRISGFGLMEMSRQRLRPGMLESTTQPCAHCHGTGIIRSDDSLALQILRQLEEEGTRKRSREVLLRAPIAVVNFLMNQKREHIAQIEARYGLSVRVEADPLLVSPDYSIDKFKTATRVIPEVVSQVISNDASLMPDLEDEDIVEEDLDEAEDETEGEAGDEVAQGEQGDEPGKKKKRRRRRRRKGNGERGADGQGQADDSGEETGDDTGEDGAAEEVAGDAEAAEPALPEAGATAEAEATTAKPRRSRTRTRKKTEEEAPATVEVTAASAEQAESQVEAADAAMDVAPAPKKSRSRKPRADTAVTGVVAEPAAAEASAPAPKKPRSRKPKAAVEAPAAAEVAAGPAVQAPAEVSATEVSATEVSATEVSAEASVAASLAPGGDAAAESHAEMADLPVDGALEPSVTANTHSDPAPAQPDGPALDATDAVQSQSEAEAEKKPRRRGWWSLGR
jgi:ribonuclease E